MAVSIAAGAAHGRWTYPENIVELLLLHHGRGAVCGAREVGARGWRGHKSCVGRLLSVLGLLVQRPGAGVGEAKVLGPRQRRVESGRCTLCRRGKGDRVLA